MSTVLEAQGSTADNANVKPTTTRGWRKAAFHTILLPSGEYVEIRIPDLPALIEAGHIPQNLLDAALRVAGSSGQNQTPSKDLIVQQREFTDILVTKMVVSPKLTPEDLDPETGIPYEDKELLVEIGTRQRDLDAEGSHIAGLEKSEKFRRFRRLGEFDPALACL
jgi:hypothetical protein